MRTVVLRGESAGPCRLRDMIATLTPELLHYYRVASYIAQNILPIMTLSYNFLPFTYYLILFTHHFLTLTFLFIYPFMVDAWAIER